MSALSAVAAGGAQNHRSCSKEVQVSMSNDHTNGVGGVDTHRGVHVAAVVDSTGRVLGAESLPATRRGCIEMLVWLRTWG